MQVSKPKILMIGTTDSRLAGHLGYTYDHLPADFDKRMVVSYSLDGKQPYAFGSKDSYVDKILRLIKRKIWYVKKYIKYGEPVKWESSKYEYIPNDVYSKTADQILAMHPGFIPDVISIHWVGEFISPKVIRDLYEKTKAHIIIVFVDEEPLAGGCHYHCNCNGYLNECINCPALLSGKKYAHEIMVERRNLLSGLPISIAGSPYDLEKAINTEIYKNAERFDIIASPQIPVYKKQECRKIFGFKNDEFVIFVGANDLTSVRKGIKYSIEAVNLLAEKYDTISVCLLGNNVFDIKKLFKHNVKLLTPGFLQFDDMLKVLAASDVFLSTTLADSGPMMVNFAFSLSVPVVSFDLGIAHTLIIDREVGCFAEYENSQSVADAIEFLYVLSPEERNIIGIKGQEVLKTHSYKGGWVDQFLANWKDGKYPIRRNNSNE